MKTIIVNVPDNEESFMISLFNKFKLKTKVLTAEDLEDTALAHWIEEGMKSDDIPEKEIMEVFKKNGIKL